MARLFRFTFYAVAFFFALVIFLIIVSQTPVFKNWLLEKTLTSINENVNATLTSGDLGGNLLTNFHLDDLALELDGKPLATVKRIDIHYSPIALLSKHLLIRTVNIENPHAFLTQIDSLRWNFSTLFASTSASSPSEVREQSGSELEWDVTVESILIRNGSARIVQAEGETVKMPALVRDFEVKLGFWFIDGKLRASLEQLNFATEQPAFHLRSMKAGVFFQQQDVTTGELEIITPASRLSSNIKVTDLKNPVVDLFLSGAPISFAEIRQVLPELTLYGDPRLDLEVTGPLNDLNLQCSIQIDRSVSHLSGHLDISEVPYQYDLHGDFFDVDLAVITQDSALASDLNCKFAIRGTGTEMGAVNAVVNAAFDSSMFMGTAFSAPDFECRILGDSLSFNINADVEGSNIDLAGDIVLSENNVEYVFGGHVRHFDVNRFAQADELRSDLNFTLNVRGAGIDSESLAGELRLQLLKSSVNGVPLDSAQIRVALAEQKADIHTLEIRSPVGTFKAHGTLSVDQSTDIRFNGDFSDFSLLSPAIPADSLFGIGRFSATVSGLQDSLLVQMKLSLPHAGMAGMRLNRFEADGAGYVTSNHYHFDLLASGAGLNAYGTVLDTLALDAQLTDEISSFRVDVSVAEQLSLQTRGDFQSEGERIIVNLNDLTVAFLEQIWRKEGGSSTITLDDNSYEIDDLRLSFAEQRFRLNGLFALDGSNSLHLALNRIDIAQYREFLGDVFDLQGTLDFDIALNGPLTQPALQGRVDFTEGEYYAVPFARLSSEFGFGDNYFRWQCRLAKDESDSLLKASGKFPLELSLSPFQYKLLPDEQLELKFSTRGLDIAFMQAFAVGIEDVSGLLVADIVLRNTLNDLRGVGPIRLINGKLRIPELGTKYEKINIVVVLKEKELLMRELQIRSGGGYIKLLEGSLSLSDDGLDEFESKLQVRRFEVINNKQLKARAEGIIELGGSIQSPSIMGDLTVDNARIFYQSFEEETAVALTAQPFFVVMSDSVDFDSSGALRFQETKEHEEQLFTDSEFYKNLTGELSFFFPRNVWIRSQDTNLEIKGEVVAVKEADDFVLFGSFSTMRGFYELFGNRFQINKGELVFNGEQELNPEVAIQATTIVTEEQPDGEQETHEFTVDISGTLLAPEFQFLLDGDVAPQEDIISILIFGKRAEMLNQNSVSAGNIGSEGGLGGSAKGLLTGQLIKQLSHKLGQGLRLDVIQIESGNEGNINEGKIKVGKYVTPDVFVTVSQDFGEQNSLVELEYEIPRKILFFNLLLQASQDRKGATGLDVIWKMEW